MATVSGLPQKNEWFSTLFVFPNRLSLFQKSIQTFSGIFGLHEFTEIKLLNGTDTFIHAHIESAVHSS
jgi:hypothetical protein